MNGEQDTELFLIRLRMSLIAQMETTRALIAASRRLLASAQQVVSVEQIPSLQQAFALSSRRGSE